MKLFTGLFLAGLVLLACGKERFETKPQLEVKSVSSYTVPVNGGLQINLEFRDKEGDVDSMLYVVRHRLNQRHTSPIENPLVIRYTIPSFPDKPKGEFELNLGYIDPLTFSNPAIDLPGSNQKEADTLLLKFYVKDAKGNVSDTVSLDRNIIVIR